jgi:hypothetical protein
MPFSFSTGGAVPGLTTRHTLPTSETKGREMDLQPDVQNDRRARMRHMLHMVGVVPVGRGEEVARQDVNGLRRDVHALIERLEPPDLFSLWLIADSLAQPAAGKGGGQSA